MTFPSEQELQPAYMPVRRLHNYVYCPRLFYLQWVENIFVQNEDTVLGSALHKRVDEPSVSKEEALLQEGGKLRSFHISPMAPESGSPSLNPRSPLPCWPASKLNWTRLSIMMMTKFCLWIWAWMMLLPPFPSTILACPI